MTSVIHRFLKNHRIVDPIIIVIITLVTARGWFQDGFIKGHDAMAPIFAAHIIRDAVLSHHEFVEWVHDWYLGCPAWGTDPPLNSFLISVVSYAFGWVGASKLLYLLFFALAGVFAYYFVYELTKSRAASFVAGLCYLFIPYHLMEMGFEGHHGCFGIPYMIVPLLFLFADKTIKNPSVLNIIITGILIVLLILAYSQVLPFLIGPFLVLYMIARIWWVHGPRGAWKSAVVACVLSVSLALLLTAFWWLPVAREVGYSFATGFSLQTAKSFSPTFFEAITLSPGSCCAPSSSYASTMLGWGMVILAVLGLLLNYRNRYTWFFAGAAVITIFLAMGPDSPVDLYGLAYHHVPFFSGLRTPGRFLLFTSFAYAVLAGFAVKSIVGWCRYPDIYLPVTALLSLAILASAFQESGRAFETFELTRDQEAAMDWLSHAPDGRVMDIPLNAWVYSAQTRNIANPMYYTWLHGKEVVDGAIPALAPKATGEMLDWMYWSARSGPTAVGPIADLMGVRYAVIEKTDPFSVNYILDGSLVKVWESSTIEIYENMDPYPRVFTVATIGEDHVEVDWEGQVGGRGWGAQCWRSDYVFDKWGRNWLDIGAEFQIPRGADILRFQYYVPQPLPNVRIVPVLGESDGSEYYYYDKFIDMSPGWHEAEIPLSAMHLRGSTEDENGQLDEAQVSQLWISVEEIKLDEAPHRFSIYFGDIAAGTGSGQVISEWQWARGTQEGAIVSPSGYGRAKTADYGWQTDYVSEQQGQDWMELGSDVQLPQNTTTISMGYYLPQSMPHMSMTVTLWEADGSGYSCDVLEDMSQGWHEVEIPLAIMVSEPSADENMRLDSDQVSRLTIRATEDVVDGESPRLFSLCLGGQISSHSYQREAVDISSEHPGKYVVQFGCTEPCTLILDESYYPGWVATIDGETISSERVYGFLNSWQIDGPGEHEVTLQFKPSPEKVAGRMISALTVFAVIACFVLPAAKRRIQRTRRPWWGDS